MITVHHLNNSRSQRVLWLLEELDLPYTVVRYERNPETMLAPAALRHIHPLGKSPVITDQGHTVAESGAIIEYLVKTHGRGRLGPSADQEQQLAYHYWMHYAEGSAMPPLVLKLIFQKMPEKAPLLLRPLVNIIAGGALKSFVNPQVKLHMDYWEQSLAKSEWFAGPTFTAADIQMSFPLEASQARAENRNAYPNINKFLGRIHARPAYKRALEKGGPYDLLS